MNQDATAPLQLLFSALAILIILSACFSASETAMMSLNKYKLKHLAKSSNKAKRIYQLLARPDRLLGIILIGNNFVNIAGSAVATLIGMHFMGELGVLIATICLTIVILIFSEITPKTYAALYPDKIAYKAAPVLEVLLNLLFPMVLITNFFSNNLLKILGISNIKNKNDSLTADELRTIIAEKNNFIATRYQEMLTSILNLEKITVDDIMIPRSEVEGINLEDPPQTNIAKLKTAQHTLLPVYNNDLDSVIGIINMRDVANNAINCEFDLDSISNYIKQPYFIPEGTSLYTQLINFQKTKHRIGLTVDEYGDILGIITMEDILEEIVGEFTTDASDISKEILQRKDGSFLIEGSTNIRWLNRTMGWQLPTNNAKTISGLIIEHLETIPDPATSLKIANYKMQILQIQDNMVKQVLIWN